ncbi:MAG: hypothetical protein FRX49_01179 [Trebouxia sp. A1-2]|nr:MAG: hypothetical protein FRX49_01179 [Trebouxia sp. A1-2]
MLKCLFKFSLSKQHCSLHSQQMILITDLGGMFACPSQQDLWKWTHGYQQKKKGSLPGSTGASETSEGPAYTPGTELCINLHWWDDLETFGTRRMSTKVQTRIPVHNDASITFTPAYLLRQPASVRLHPYGTDHQISTGSKQQKGFDLLSSGQLSLKGTGLEQM